MKVPTTIIAVLAIMLGGTTLSLAQSNAPGAVELSNGTRVPQNPTLPKLNLSNPQRELVRKTVLTEHTDVQFELTSTRAAKDFNPTVGATLPKGVTAHSLPAPVLAEIPDLRNYKYVTMKDQVLIVNGMTDEIVDLFSETQPVT